MSWLNDKSRKPKQRYEFFFKIGTSEEKECFLLPRKLNMEKRLRHLVDVDISLQVCIKITICKI